MKRVLFSAVLAALLSSCASQKGYDDAVFQYPDTQRYSPHYYNPEYVYNDSIPPWFIYDGDDRYIVFNNDTLKCPSRPSKWMYSNGSIYEKYWEKSGRKVIPYPELDDFKVNGFNAPKGYIKIPQGMIAMSSITPKYAYALLFHGAAFTWQHEDYLKADPRLQVETDY